MGFGGWVTTGSMFILVLVVMMIPIIILPASATINCSSGPPSTFNSYAPATFVMQDFFSQGVGDDASAGTVTFEVHVDGALAASGIAQIDHSIASLDTLSFTISQPGTHTVSIHCKHSSGSTADGQGYFGPKQVVVTGSSSSSSSGSSNNKETVPNNGPTIRDCSDDGTFKIVNDFTNREIWGKVPEYKRGQDVRIIITYDTGFTEELKITATKDGEFKMPLHHNNFNHLLDTLEVFYGDRSLGECQYIWKQADSGIKRPDRDLDGIEDELDSCPTQPETKNNYQDSDGCPDEPAPYIVGPSRVPDIIKEDVKFTQDGIFRANGCGGEKWWANVPDFDFKKSCNEHDFCYGEGGDANDRKICDEQLRDSIKKNSHLGSLAAWTYYYGVRAAGVIFFNCNEDLWIKCQ